MEDELKNSDPDFSLLKNEFVGSNVIQLLKMHPIVDTRNEPLH